MATLLTIPPNCAAQDEEFSQDEEEFSQTKDSKNDPVALFNLGQDAHSKGELEKALEFYERALKANPVFVEAEYQRGIVYRALNRNAEAERSFRNTAKLKKDWSLPYVQLGLLFLEARKFPEAEQFLNEGIRLDQNSFIAYVALSNVLLKTNAPESRLRLLLAKLKQFENTQNLPIAFWTSKAVIERKLGDIKAAGNSLARAFLLNSKDQVALAELVEIYLIQGLSRKAIEVSKGLLERSPQSKNAKLLLARSYNSIGDSSEALRVLKAIETPDNEILKFQTAIETGGNFNVESLEKMLAENENNVSALARLCSLTRVSAPQKALEYCNRALIIEKNNINHAIGYGAALVQLKRYVSAVMIFQSLLKQSPENYTIHANLATALFQMQNFEAAKREYVWITEKRPQLAIAHYFLGISYDRLGEYQNALVSYKEFLKLAGANGNQTDIEKVNLRLPILERQLKRSGRKKKK